MVVIIDFHHLFTDVHKESSTFEDDVSRLIAYHLYREYHIDSGVYSLENRLLGKYCNHHLDILSRCLPIGIMACRHDRRRSIIRIRNRDAYAILLNEAPYE